MRSPAGGLVYLHGRGDRPRTPPGDLVLGVDWRVSVHAPALDERWQAQAFRHRVDEVARWLEVAGLAIGHSFGGWLLLCASLQLREAGREAPPLLLLSSVLGPGPLARGGAARGEAARAFSIPPRVASVHRALGLAPGEGPRFEPESLELIHATDDDQCPVRLPERLAERYPVRFVPGGHRLEGGVARTVVAEALDRSRRRMLARAGAIR